MALDLQQCYEVLQVRPGLTSQHLKAAYHHQIKTWHPDLFTNNPAMQPVCLEKMKRIIEAYKRLEPVLRLSQAVAHKPPPLVTLQPASKGDLYGYVDEQGYFRIPPIYESAAPFSEGLAAISQQNTFGYIDATGALAIPLRYSSAGNFRHNRAVVQAVRFGFIDRLGDWIVPPRFEAAKPFQERFAAVKAGGQWGYIREDGDWLTFPQFDEASDFQNGRATATRAGKRVSIYSTGDIIPI